MRRLWGRKRRPDTFSAMVPRLQCRKKEECEVTAAVYTGRGRYCGKVFI